MISPIHPNITENSASSVFNFVNAHIDQRHLPPVINEQEYHHNGNRSVKTGGLITAFQIEKNLKNYAANSKIVDVPKPEQNVVCSDNENSSEPIGDKNRANNVGKTTNIFECLSKNNKYIPNRYSKSPTTICVQDQETVSSPVPSSVKVEKKIDLLCEKVALKPTVPNHNSVSEKVNSVAESNREDHQVKSVPKKPKVRQEEATIAVFNFTSRKDVPDYISNDTSRVPSRPVIPKVS